MKLIVSSIGTVIIHASWDDISPPEGILQRDLVDFIAEEYEFSVKPIIPDGVPSQLIPVLNFQSGKLLKETGSIPIHQIAAFTNGDAISAATTDLAEVVLDDYMRALDEGLGYRFGSQPWKRTYVSGLVVQFDNAIEDIIAPLAKVGKILDNAMPREGNPFKPKMLQFGFGDPVAPMAMNSISAIEGSDFSLQRRVGEPYSSNRYFSNATLRTEAHLKMLEEIEAALG